MNDSGEIVQGLMLFVGIPILSIVLFAVFKKALAWFWKIHKFFYTLSKAERDRLRYSGGGKHGQEQSAAEIAEAALREARKLERIKGMVLVPAGAFFMGSPEGKGRMVERPRHEVYLDAYYIDKHKVTAAQYKDFAKAAGWVMPEQESWGTDQHPVINVDWNEAAAYCNWAGGRLPTEAEWEKAARGGTDTDYSFGDDESKLGEYAWYGKTSNRQSHPVGQKKPNPYGLYDMHGNAWEWVSDWYDMNYYKISPGENPKGPDSGSHRCLRGGAWNLVHSYLRSANRYRNYPGLRYNCNGFRCVVPARDL